MKNEKAQEEREGSQWRAGKLSKNDKAEKQQESCWRTRKPTKKGEANEGRDEEGGEPMKNWKANEETGKSMEMSGYYAMWLDKLSCYLLKYIEAWK